MKVLVLEYCAIDEKILSVLQTYFLPLSLDSQPQFSV